MTAADLLARLNVLDNELSIDTGAADESRALLALDLAQDYYETAAAIQGRLVNTVATLVMTPSSSSSSWPSGMLRIDSVLYSDGSGEVEYRDQTGAHLRPPSSPWPLISGSLAQAGKPYEFWDVPDAALYWIPTPDAAYTVSVIGYRAQSSLTTRDVVFGHSDVVAGPLCAFALRLMELGVDDPSEEYQTLADAWFLPLIKMQRRRLRPRPVGRVYSRVHHA